MSNYKNYDELYRDSKIYMGNFDNIHLKKKCMGCFHSSVDPSNLYKLSNQHGDIIRIPCNQSCKGYRPRDSLYHPVAKDRGTYRETNCSNCLAVVDNYGKFHSVRYNKLGHAIHCPPSCIHTLPKWIEGVKTQPREWEKYTKNPQYYGKYDTAIPLYNTVLP